jgi:hypothetical protein
MNNGNAIAKFALGQTITTPGALKVLAANGRAPAEFLDRHARGDWGQLSASDAQLNDAAIEYADRIMSAYDLADGGRVWVITEADRSRTCVLLPSEY